MNNRRKQLMLASAKEYCKCVVEGKTLKYNQLANIVNKQAEVIQGLTISTTNGLIKINGTSTTDNTYFDYQIAEYSYTGFTPNHKYFIWLQQSNYGRVFIVASSPYNEINDSPIIFTCTSSQYLILRVATNGLTYNNYCVRVNVIDLTALGLDSITSPSDFFATALGKYIAKGNYLPYEPNGKFIHAQSPIHFKDVNIWNEQWENGIYYEGNFYSGGYEDFICSVDMIKVSPNKEYFYFNGSSNFDCYIVYEMFDKNKNYISRNFCENKHSFRTTNDCEYVLFYVNDTYGNKYNHDICISENVYDINRTQGILSGSSASTPRAFEEGKYYIGLSGNNYYYPNYISNFSYDGLTMSFQTSSGGYGVVLPFKVEGNKTYYLDYVSNPTESVVYVSYFDKNGNYIDYVSTSNHLVTTPANCYWLVLVLRPQTNVLATYRNIVVKEIGYQRYCGTNALMEGLSLQKGDYYKTYTIESVEYNQQVNSNSVTTSGTLNANGYADLFNFSVESSQKLVLVFNVSLSGSDISNCTIQLINTYQEVHTTIVNGIAYLYIETHNNLASDDLYLRLWNYGASNVTFSNVKANIINLTKLGLDNVNSVADFKQTKLGMFLSKGYYLPYTLTNKTIKDQIVRTMKEIDLSTLTWTYNTYINAWQSDLSSLFVKSYAGNVLPCAIAEKYRTIKYNDFSSAVEGDMGLFSTKPILEIKSNDSVNAPSGKALLELETPETNVWYHLFIGDYNEFEQYSGEVYKLDRDLSDLNVFGITADIGENQGGLLFLIGRGNNNDYCYENGYIYVKTDDIQNSWAFDLLINNIPNRMVSRRTINVESENEIDMDFTKE